MDDKKKKKWRGIEWMFSLFEFGSSWQPVYRNPDAPGYSVHVAACPYDHGGACTCPPALRRGWWFYIARIELGGQLVNGSLFELSWNIDSNSGRGFLGFDLLWLQLLSPFAASWPRAWFWGWQSSPPIANRKSAIGNGGEADHGA